MKTEDREFTGDDGKLKINMEFSVSLWDAVRVILAWYWSDEEDLPDLKRAIGLVDKFIEGKTAKFTEHDFWLFFDALGAYDQRGPFLQELYKRADEGWCRLSKSA